MAGKASPGSGIKNDTHRSGALRFHGSQTEQISMPIHKQASIRTPDAHLFVVG